MDILELHRCKESENRKWQHAYAAIVFFALALSLISFHTTWRVILKSLFTVPWEHTYVGYFLMAVHIRWTILLLQAPGPLYCNYIILLYVISATKEDFLNQGKHERHCQTTRGTNRAQNFHKYFRGKMSFGFQLKWKRPSYHQGNSLNLYSLPHHAKSHLT